MLTGDTPLNAVIGYSQMLIEDADLDGDQANVPDLEKIHAAGYHLLGLVNAVLDLSKIEAGQMELFNEEFRLSAVLTEITAELKPALIKNNNKLEVQIADGLDLINGDVAKIRSAIGHVFNNANKYTKDGFVTVTCRTVVRGRRPYVSIAIRDTGIGISEQHLPSLFEQFAVADDQTSTKYGGTGVGLALTRKLCQLMGGDVQVETTLGKGSCFTLTFPSSQDFVESTESLEPFSVVASNNIPERTDGPDLHISIHNGKRANA